MPGAPDAAKQYARITARRITERSDKDAQKSGKEYEARSKTLSREEAYEYIAEHGLTEAMKDESGTIWDTPSMDFFETYGGNIYIRNKIGA